jgi:hypothetical protein
MIGSSVLPAHLTVAVQAAISSSESLLGPQIPAASRHYGQEEEHRENDQMRDALNTVVRPVPG